MSRKPANRRDANGRSMETVFTHVGMGPSGVIDFIQPLSTSATGQDASSSSHLVAADDPSLVDPYAVRGGPPAYLEAHGVRYVPEAATAAAMIDAEERASDLVSMARPYDGPRDDIAGMSDDTLTARVDDRIRHFMQRSRSATQGANERLAELHANMDAEKPDACRAEWTERLNALQKEMETQTQRKKMEAPGRPKKMEAQARQTSARPQQRTRPDFDW